MDLFPEDSAAYQRDRLLNASMSLYTRLRAAKNYDPQYKIKSDVWLFKAGTVSLIHGDEDLGLSNLCQNVIEVKTFNGNHITVLENPELAQHINELIRK